MNKFIPGINAYTLNSLKKLILKKNQPMTTQHASYVCFAVCVDALRPSQQFFSHVSSVSGLTLPTSDPIYSKAKNRNNKPEKRTTKPDTQISLVKPDKRNSKTDTQVMIVDNKPPKQDENKEPRNNKDVVNNKTAAKVTESRKNRKNRRDKENDRVPDMGYVADNTITVQAMSVGSVMSSGVEGNHGKRLAPSNKKKKGERFGREVTIGSATTGEYSEKWA